MTDYPYNPAVAKIINDQLMNVYPPNPLRILDALKDAGYHVVSTPTLLIRKYQEDPNVRFDYTSIELHTEIDNTLLDYKHRISPYMRTLVDENYAKYVMKALTTKLGETMVQKLIVEDEWQNRLVEEIKKRA